MALVGFIGSQEVAAAYESSRRPQPITIHSSRTGADYAIGIYLPPSYSASSTAYPVIYVTDGDAPYPPDGRFANFKAILQHVGVEAILVGVGGTARRDTDFVLPGAAAYHEFLTQELLPFVESQVRADPKRRVLSGVSLGGSFVLTALFLEAPKTLVFSYYISAEGAFFQPSFIAQEQSLSRSMGSRSIPATVILAHGRPNVWQNSILFANTSGKFAPGIGVSQGFSRDGTNSEVVDTFYQRMLERHFVDLVLIETRFATDHIGTDNPSFEDAVTRLFK